MMLASCDGDPHCTLAGQLQYPQFFRIAVVQDNLSFPWRWRITALIAICTLLLAFLTMESALADQASEPVTTRDDNMIENSLGYVHDNANKSKLETDKFAGRWPTKKLPSHDGRQVLMRFKPNQSNVKQPQLRKRGLRPSGVQSAFIKKSDLNHPVTHQAGKPPWESSPTSTRHGRPQRFTAITERSDSSKHRILVSTGGCTNKDISIFQSADGSSGIPRYAVQIMNNCMSDCAPSDIHVFCGWFASALLVNPNSFKRVAFNDCLVNGGKPLRHGETLRFTYANSFMYPLRFKSASFCKK